MPGGAAFGQQRIFESEKEHRGGSPFPPYARGGIFFRKLYPVLFADAGRIGRLLSAKFVKNRNYNLKFTHFSKNLKAINENKGIIVSVKKIISDQNREAIHL